MNRPKKLFIVDDSPLIRRAMRAIFDQDADIEIVGEAANGVDALRGVKELTPDVVTLDVNIPVMDGIKTLKHIMIECPTPTVMLSTLTQEGARLTFDALRYGAVDFIPKPSQLDDSSLAGQEALIRKKVKWAARVEIDVLRYIRVKPSNHFQNHVRQPDYIMAIGGHEGGYSALLKIVPQLMAHLPAAIVVVLYEEPQNVEAFSRYLNEYTPLRVKRAVDEDVLHAGTCYLACGDEYVTLQPRGNSLTLHIHPAPFASLKGSVNRILFSTADIMTDRSVGVILSGSGDDGAEGIEEVLRMGGRAIIQDPKSCLSKEMSRTAMDLTRADIIVADSAIASTINQLLLS